MITIIKSVEVYAPEYLGEKHIVILGDKIGYIYDDINIPKDFIPIKIIEGKGRILFPGFIDSHVHITGGGGEGGFSTRTPEIKLTDLTTAGITTVVGCLGTDGVCRNPSDLIAKAKALEDEGLNTYCYTGSYGVPVRTLMGSINEDIMLIDKYIGVGEVAISDHRSSQPTFEQFVHLAAQARVAGMLSHKAGIVNVHLGDGKKKLEMLFNLLKETDIPPSNILPTHINRDEKLFEEGIKYVNEGGYIDLTTSSDEGHENGELTASEGLKKFLDKGMPIEHITFSSDGNGSMPIFDEDGNIKKMKICSVETLYSEVKKAILNYNIPIEKAIKVITSNVADLLQLSNKGRIRSGFDADFVMVKKDTLAISEVCAKGKLLVEEGIPIVRGVYN